MDTNKLENKHKGQTMISDQSHRLIESNSKNIDFIVKKTITHTLLR